MGAFHNSHKKGDTGEFLGQVDCYLKSCRPRIVRRVLFLFSGLVYSICVASVIVMVVFVTVVMFVAINIALLKPGHEKADFANQSQASLATWSGNEGAKSIRGEAALRWLMAWQDVDTGKVPAQRQTATVGTQVHS
jgi:hypothetical protein